MVGKKLVPQDYDEPALVELLQAKGFDTHDGSYDYLLSIQTRALTRDRVASLEREADEAAAAAAAARAATTSDMWRADIGQLCL